MFKNRNQLSAHIKHLERNYMKEVFKAFTLEARQFRLWYEHANIVKETWRMCYFKACKNTEQGTIIQMHSL